MHFLDMRLRFPINHEKLEKWQKLCSKMHRSPNRLSHHKFSCKLWASTEREHVPCFSMDAYILVFYSLAMAVSHNSYNIFLDLLTTPDETRETNQPFYCKVLNT